MESNCSNGSIQIRGFSLAWFDATLVEIIFYRVLETHTGWDNLSQSPRDACMGGLGHFFLPVANSTPRNPFATSCQVSRCCGPRVPVLQNQLRSSVAAAWMGDRCVLDFAPALRLLRSQIMCTLQKFFDWDYKPRSATYKKRSNFNMQIKDPGIHARDLRLMEKPN